MIEEYLKSLSHLKPLAPEEERALWKRYKEEGELDARQSLIEHYQPLVFREAAKYGLQEAVTLDLIQEGTVGLMEAAERYDPSRGVAFSLFALHRVRGRMVDFLSANRQEVLLSEGEDEKVFLSRAVPDTAFDTADRSVLGEAVGRALARLPGKERDVISAMYMREESASETADTLDVSTAYVYRLQKRGIRRLRGMLSKVMHDRK